MNGIHYRVPGDSKCKTNSEFWNYGESEQEVLLLQSSNEKRQESLAFKWRVCPPIYVESIVQGNEKRLLQVGG